MRKDDDSIWSYLVNSVDWEIFPGAIALLEHEITISAWPAPTLTNPSQQPHRKSHRTYRLNHYGIACWECGFFLVDHKRLAARPEHHRPARSQPERNREGHW